MGSMAATADSRCAGAWQPSSWRGKPALQMAEWEDKALAESVLSKLGSLPPLVQPSEADRLKKLLAAAGRGERFIVQGGDCAERFIDCEADRLAAQVRLDHAHVEYFRGISNPIGCKIGPSMKAEELQELVKVLNPNKEEGRLTLITRYGAGKVEDMLPTHIEAVKATGVPVVWQCDAVHGNGIVA